MLVLEAQPDVGGAVRSDSEVHPDYVHDTFSAFYPLAAASPAIQSFRLEEHGLRWRHAPAVLGHPRPDGSWAVLHRDREVTAALLDEQFPGDGEAWLDTCAEWDRIGGHLVDALLAPFPPVRAGIALLARLRSVGGLAFVRTMLSPASELGRARFGGESPRLLLAGNAGHSDIPLDAAGSGLMGLLLCMLGQTVGFPVPEGGAGRLAHALAERVRSLGGTIQCSAPVVRVLVEGGRATGVRTEDGTDTPHGTPWSRTSSPPTCTAAWSPMRSFRPGRSGRCAASSSTPPRSRWTGRWTVRSRGRRRRRTQRAPCTSRTRWSR